MAGCCARCLLLLRSELSCARLWVFHGDWKAFTYTPWFPASLKVQWLFVLYRWVLALYFLAWLAVTIIDAQGIGAKYLIYLTHWGFILWNAYLIFAAISTTLSFAQVHLQCKQNVEFVAVRQFRENYQWCCDTPSNKITWRDRIHWVLFIVSTEGAVAVSILFWVFFYDPDDGERLFSSVSIHVHMLNGIVAVVDLWVTGIPVRLLHVIYILTFGIIYVAFTGLYYVFNCTDPGGNHYIYPMLDYGRNPGLASGLVIGCTLGFLTLLHVTFFAQYLIRHCITYRVCGRHFHNRAQEETEHSDIELVAYHDV